MLPGGPQISAEKSPFLTDRLKIWMLPTLALIRNEKTEDYVVGFNELGGKDDFPTSALEGRLQAAGLLHANQQARPTALHPPPHFQSYELRSRMCAAPSCKDQPKCTVVISHSAKEKC